MRRALLLAVVALSGCWSSPGGLHQSWTTEPGLPIYETRRVWYPGRTQLKKEYEVKMIEEGRVVRSIKHGAETEWWRDGTVKSERVFADGEPAGTWRTWYADGTPESVVEIGDGTEVLPIRWWHPDGTPKAQGHGLGGVREGEWTYWHPDGTPASQGAFAQGLRDGPWKLWYPNGMPEAEGTYRAGRRVGAWTLWNEEGVGVVRQGDPISGGPDGEGGAGAAPGSGP